MAKYEAELKTLKEKLQTSDEFHEIMKYFFDYLAEQSDFLNMGRRGKNKLIKKALEYIGQKLFQEDAKVTNLLLTEIKNYKFYHGACFINGRMSNIIYFEDIDMGMISVLRSPMSHDVNHVRFTCFKIDANKDTFFVGNSGKIN